MNLSPQNLFKLAAWHTVHSWWVILFAIFCAIIYERAINRQEILYQSLQKQLFELQNQKQEALSLRETLLQQINSQSDPDWIELTLMKGLGLVPEGQTKVLFIPFNKDPSINP